MTGGPIDEQYDHVRAEGVADAYPEGGWREHLARLERRVARLEVASQPMRWARDDDEPPEREL